MLLYRNEMLKSATLPQANGIDTILLLYHKFHRKTDLSSADTQYFSSYVTDNFSIFLVCPYIVSIHSIASMFHSLIAISLLPDITKLDLDK